MRPSLISLLATSIATVAFASTCWDGDQLLQNNSPLSQLCPNGFGQFSPGGIQNAINNQQSNTRMIIAAADQFGVPENLALAVAYHESEGFNSCAGSDTGVKGPMQLTQSTARALGYDRNINEQNIMGGMRVLKAAIDACGATNYTCLAARYNGSSRLGEQAGWARGVAAADQQLTSNPQMIASACGGSDMQCEMGPGDFPGSPAINGSAASATPTLYNAPTTADVRVAVGQV
jgi:Transglycosylase SLT domain